MVTHLGSAPRVSRRGRFRSLLCGAVLVVAVLLVHAWLMNSVMIALIDSDQATDRPERLQVRYLKEMEPVDSRTDDAAGRVTVAAVKQAKRAMRRAAESQPKEAPAPDPAASAPSSPDEPASDNELVATPDAPPNESATEPSGAAPSPGAASSVAAQTPRLDGVWPQSTRVHYTAVGYYRGEVHGNASVEWIRLGDRYQMQMDVSLGLGLFKRSAFSSGRIGAEGVMPERYEESTKLPFRDVRTLSVIFEEQTIDFSQGQRAPRVPGVQDTASQFVQLTYLFTSRPELANAGQRMEFPLAFPRGLRGYAYQVQGSELLQTPIGPIETLHVIPRRLQPTSNDLVAQAWFAPAYRYFPIRIRLTLGEENYIDLMISKKPEVAD